MLHPNKAAEADKAPYVKSPRLSHDVELKKMLNSMAASSAGRLSHDNVTVTFDLLVHISSSLSQDAQMTKVWRKSIQY